MVVLLLLACVSLLVWGLSLLGFVLFLVILGDRVSLRDLCWHEDGD